MSAVHTTRKARPEVAAAALAAMRCAVAMGETMGAS